MLEDPGVKRLLTSYPDQALAVLAPELVSWGVPQKATVVGQEVLSPSGGASGFLDVALYFKWSNRSAVLLLVEHWSEARKVDLRRVNFYVADLHRRHPEVEVVLPVMLVTDPKDVEVSVRFTTTIAKNPVLDLRCRLVRTDNVFRERWVDARNRVAAVLSVLAPAESALEAIKFALRLGARAPGPIEDWGWLFPLLESWCKLTEEERRALDKYLKEDSEMNSVSESIRAEGRVEGEVKGLQKSTKGILEVILQQVLTGQLGKGQAVAQIQGMLEKGLLDNQLVQKALLKLKSE